MSYKCALDKLKDETTSRVHECLGKKLELFSKKKRVSLSTITGFAKTLNCLLHNWLYIAIVYF